MGVYVGFDVGKSFEEGRQAFDADTPAVVRRWGDTTYVVDVIVGDYSAYNSQVFTLCYLDNSFNIPALKKKEENMSLFFFKFFF